MRHLLATHVITSSPSSGVHRHKLITAAVVRDFFVARKTPNVPPDCRKAALAATMASCFLFHSCKCMQILPTLHMRVCNFHSKEKRPLFWMALFHPAFGTLQHSRPGRRMCLLHAFSSPRASMPVSAFQGHSLVNTEGRDPSSRRDLEPDPPACFFQLLN